VCLHAGEVLLSRDGAIGEPVDVVEAVERAAQADEVVFTEAVNLARNRAEAAAEPCGSVELPGRAERLQLYRCVRSPEGLPFGGRDAYARASALELLRVRAAHLGTHSVDVVRTGAQRLKRTTLPGLKALQGKGLSSWSAGRSALGPALRKLPTHLRALPARLRALPRRTRLGAAAGVVLLGVLALLTVLHLRSPVVRARGLLEAGRPGEALRLLEAVPAAEARGDGALRQVRAQALHAQGRHGDEHSVLAGLDADGREDVEARTLDGLAEDFAEDEGDRAVRRLLGGFPEDEVRGRFETLAEEEASARQWGALRYLEAQQQTEGLDLVEVYAASLQSTSCSVRSRAARRLSALGDEEAVPALERLRALPKERGLLGGRNCGQDEAAEALQVLRRKAR
jgi:serine/threonine protein kinase, bacterial